MIKTKFYLPNLNALRAIAALMVVVSHIERKKSDLNLVMSKQLISWGPLGVTLFFVLSGFLITYLLLIEKDKFSNINLKDFYFRRILRIWPLYFLILFFVYVSVPYLFPEYYLGEKERYTLKSAFLNILFLTNITMVIKLTPLLINSIWSIGVEEQFYIFWPWVIRMKNKITIIVSLVFLFPITKVFLLLLTKVSANPNFILVYDVLNLTRFDSMAIGGFFGVLAYRKEIKIGKFRFNYDFFTTKRNQYVCYLGLIMLFIMSQCYASSFNFINFQIMPFLLAICILNLATNKNSIITIENNFLNYFGKISYSLYLNHVLIIYLCFPVISKYLVGYCDLYKNIILYFVTLLMVVIISMITYHFYEMKFLKLKSRFSRVVT